MIINDLNLIGIVGFPDEANAPLIVDPDAVLSSSITFQFLKSIGWWNAEIGQVFGVVEISQLAIGRLLDILGQAGFVDQSRKAGPHKR